MESAAASFKTLYRPSGPCLLKERKSKFIGYAYPVASAEAAQQQVQALWKEYPDATHICYAYRIGNDPPQIRINDDGEPAHSAGSPIFGQIEAFDLQHVLICVVRYYGGTKLGVGGLIQAYRESARLCLEQADIREVRPQTLLTLSFEYASLDAVMRVISQHQLEILDQQMHLSCTIKLAAIPENLPAILEAFGPLSGVDLRVQNDMGFR